MVYRDRWKRLIRARRRQEELYLPLIKACQERRRGRGNDGGDAVTSYVDSLLDLEVPAEVDPKGKGIHRGRRRRKLSEGEMVGLVSEYMGAATETVLTAMEWTLANLVRRPDIQSRLRGEVEAGGGEACAYLRAVVMESLRRHPTVPSVVRHMSSDALLGSTPVTQGSVVNFVVAKIGRDKKVTTSIILEQLMYDAVRLHTKQIGFVMSFFSFPFNSNRYGRLRMSTLQTGSCRAGKEQGCD